MGSVLVSVVVVDASSSFALLSAAIKRGDRDAGCRGYVRRMLQSVVVRVGATLKDVTGSIVRIRAATAVPVHDRRIRLLLRDTIGIVPVPKNSDVISDAVF